MQEITVIQSPGARTSLLRLRSSEEASVDPAEGTSGRQDRRKPVLRSCAAWGGGEEVSLHRVQF